MTDMPEKGELRLELQLPVTVSVYANCYAGDGHTIIEDDITVSVDADTETCVGVSLKDMLTRLYDMEEIGEQDTMLATIRGFRAVAGHALMLAAKLEDLAVKLEAEGIEAGAIYVP
jgi:hypothetical protein